MNRAPSTAPPGRIAFVGTGPGDPGLLTVRARDALAAAPLVVTDPDVPEAVLALVADGAEVRSSAPSAVPTTARRDTRSTTAPSSVRSDTTSAKAPIGALQPASSPASTARSAVTAARVYSSSSTAVSCAARS